jgi:hypothetical protein
MNGTTPAQREAALMELEQNEPQASSHTPRAPMYLDEAEVSHDELGKALEHLRIAVGEPEFMIAGRTTNRARQLAQLAVTTAQRALGKKEAARLFAQLFGAVLADSNIDVITDALVSSNATTFDPKDTLGYLGHSGEPGGADGDEFDVDTDDDADAPVAFDVTAKGWAEP